MSLRGRVLSIQGESVTVSDGAREYTCILRGSLKKEKTQKKNLLSVGDFVSFTLEDDKGLIEEVEERFSYLTRKDIVQNKEQLIAVNIDQVLITVSVVNPPLKPSLIDRYLIACEKGNMQPVLIINKVDLLEDYTANERILEKEKELYENCLEAYPKIGLPIISVSAKKSMGIEELRKQMHGKASVFSGQSGVGKSSLINLLCNMNLPTQETVAKTRKGMHTTTRAQLIPLEENGFIIDTPGIKSFGVWDLTIQDIVAHFTDLKEIGRNCRFHNCMHLQEPDCAVKKAIEENTLSYLRFESYLSLIGSIGKKDRWR